MGIKVLEPPPAIYEVSYQGAGLEWRCILAIQTEVAVFSGIPEDMMNCLKLTDFFKVNNICQLSTICHRSGSLA